jgi:hypothetical protein
MWKSLWVFLVVSQGISVSHADLISPYATKKQKQDHLKEYDDGQNSSFIDIASVGPSAYGQRVSLDALDFQSIPEWSSYEQIQLAFFLARDTRLFQDPSVQNFARRITWLYPFDGCFTRAGLSSRLLDQLGFPDVSLVYVFGDLYYPAIATAWWYHVAPAVRIGEEIYVFDQAMNPAGPLLYAEWLSKFVRSDKDLKGSICAEAAWGPTLDCTHQDFQEGKVSNKSLDEWNKNDWMPAERVYLKDKAESWLGENPPWFSF